MQPGARHPNPRRAAVPLHIDLRRVSQVQVANHFEPVLQTLESEVPIDLLMTDIVVQAAGYKGDLRHRYDIHGAQTRERLLREVSCALGSV